VKRLRLPRQKANDGKTLVTIDLTEIEHRPLPARSPPDHHSAAKTMQARIEALETELAKVEAAAANHRADFERERGRSDRLLSEVLRATHDLIGANEVAARAESELVVVRVQAEGERTAAMRAEADLAAIRARASWSSNRIGTSGLFRFHLLPTQHVIRNEPRRVDCGFAQLRIL
jgi:hypothetical protein